MNPQATVETRAVIIGTVTEDALVALTVADLVATLMARADPADLGGQGYLVVPEDLVVPREEDPLVAAAAVEVVAQGHPFHLSSI